MVFLGFPASTRRVRTDLRARAAPRRRAGRQAPNPRPGSRIPDAVVASRTEERTILHEMGQDAAAGTPSLDALELAERLAAAAEEAHVDLTDLGRRARAASSTLPRDRPRAKLF